MSELEDLCRQLAEICNDASRMASGLHRQSQQLSVSASRAATVVSRSGPVAGAQTAMSLMAAARATADAATLLSAASTEGRLFVTRVIAGSGTTSAGTGSGTSAPSSVAAAPSIADISAWLPEVNPGYDGDPFDPRSSNCGTCAAAVFDRLSGLSADSTSGLATLSTTQMEARTNRKQVELTPDDIARRLIENGPGSHAVVGVDRQFGAGHWFNAYYDGERVVAIDGQSGDIHDWPPEYGSTGNPVVHWDAGI